MSTHNYILLFSDDAKMDYLCLTFPEKLKINRAGEKLHFNPFIGKKLSGDLKGNYSIRARPYRIIYTIDKQKRYVHVSTIKHRQRAYR